STEAFFHYTYANLLADQRRYEEAQIEFQKAVDADENYSFAYHNMAYFLKRLAKYNESRTAWDEARRSYERSLPQAIADSNAYHFYHYGSVLSGECSEVDEAESILKEGLEVYPEHVESLI